MNHRIFLSGVRRQAHSRRHESRRGAPSTLSTLLFAAASLLIPASPARAGTLQPVPAHHSLLPVILSGQYLAAQNTDCAPGGTGIADGPRRPNAPALVVEAPRWTHSSLAVDLLPRTSRWLRTARTHRDEPLSVETILPKPREMGMPARGRNRAFELLLGPEHTHAAVMFLSGLALFLISSVLGITIASPRDPVRPAAPHPGCQPLLPMLLSHPRCTVTPRQQS